MSMSLRLLLPLSCLLVSTTAAAATWPGAAPCDTTLQACIDAEPDGGEVVIDSDGPIDEAILIERSLDLRGAAMRRPQFAAGRGIRARFNDAASPSVGVSRLALRDASVELEQLGTGGAAFSVEDLLIESSNATVLAGIRVYFAQDGATARSVRVERNRLTVAAPGFFDAAMALNLRGQAVDVDVRWNTLESVGLGEGWGILADVTGGASVDALIQGNEVRGGFGRGGITLSEGLFSSTPSNVTARVLSNAVIGHPGRLGGGIEVIVYNGTTDAQVFNNTVTNSDLGLMLAPWGGTGGGPGTGSISGRVFNNLFAYNRRGITTNPGTLDGLLHDNNLLHGISGTVNNLPAAPNDVLADPRLRSIEAPRLAEDSPAREAGNSLAWLFAGDASLHDADGLRRLVDTIDIGAYEFGHRSLPVRKTATDAVPYTAVADAAIDADRGARLFPTNNFAIAGVTNMRPLGVFDFFEQWWVRNADDVDMPRNAGFNLFAAEGASATGVRQHSATGSNTLGGATLIDWSQSNAMPDRILLFTQATPFGAIANPDPVALLYGADRWQLATVNGAEFTLNTLWNLYAQDPSPNAFRHTVAAGGNASALDHPLLNDTPCARVHASPIVHGGSNGIVFDVFYSDGRWRLFSSSGFSAGQQFNVLVVPEQVEACSSGRLFRDGYEALDW